MTDYETPTVEYLGDLAEVTQVGVGLSGVAGCENPFSDGDSDCD